MKAWFPILLLALSSLTSCETNHKSATSPELGEGEFQSFTSQPGTLNIVDFHADWCGPCKRLGPILADIASENTEIVRLRKVDIDAEGELAAQQGVRSIPDVRFYIDGKMVDKFVGAYPRERIERMIETHQQSITKHAGKTPDAQQGAATQGSSGIELPAGNPLPPGMTPQ